ncbi:MAG: hypoxanthine phosphoribosyltransferase [Verrucomicrobiaceae bacterium]|nr:hypoxanthine phosphoribosyltransferase [Verrucomicrobiaceae bacterium]
MTLSPTGIMSDLDRVLIDADAIRRRVTALAAQVAADFAGQTITVVAIMDGGLFFVADLLREIDLPVRLHTLSASSYHGGTQTSGELRLNWPAALDLAGHHVLLLDDILDTGLTLAAVQEKIRAQQPAALRTGVLLGKKRKRLREAAAEYVGFEIEDEFVVGYGMDYQGRFRNLPCIGILRLPS